VLLERGGDEGKQRGSYCILPHTTQQEQQRATGTREEEATPNEGWVGRLTDARIPRTQKQRKYTKNEDEEKQQSQKNSIWPVGLFPFSFSFFFCLACFVCVRVCVCVTQILT